MEGSAACEWSSAGLAECRIHVQHFAGVQRGMLLGGPWQTSRINAAASESKVELGEEACMAVQVRRGGMGTVQQSNA